MSGILRTVESAVMAIKIRQKVVLSINGKRLPLGRVRCCYSLPYSTSTGTIVRGNYMRFLVVYRYCMYRWHS